MYNDSCFRCIIVDILRRKGRYFEKMSVLEQMEHALAIFDEYYSYEEIMGAERLRRRASLAEMSGMPKDKTIRVLNSLLEKGLVAKIGAGRAVAYTRR